MEQELRALPDRPPRQCPVCGARVAEGAKTCLMCGASLEEEISIEETPPVRRLTQRQLLILGGVALIILALAVIMGLKLSTGGTIPTLTPTVTHTPTLTQTPSVTPTPTITPSPLPTATPIPPQSYTVQEGDTLLSIAVKFDLTTEEIKAYNGLTSDIIVEGDAVLIPPATPTPGPTPTLDPMLPTPTYAPFILHTVKSGDTLSTIAEEYNVNVSDIQAANNIEPGFTMIQAGNVLEIPQYTPTPTPIVEEVIAGEESADQTIYTPPTLLYPRNGEVFTGTQSVIMLQWAATGILDDQEYYRVAFTASTAEGPETTYTYVRTTSWRVPSALLPPPETAERTCTWTISTVQQRGTEADPTYTVIGEAKDSRTFLWNTAQP